MLQDWMISSWYCPNCKTEVCELKDKKDQIKAKCERCGVHMVRKYIVRRHLQHRIILNQREFRTIIYL